MNKTKLVLHILIQVLAQGAVIALIPLPAKPYFNALAAILGVVYAAWDNLYPISSDSAPVSTEPTQPTQTPPQG